MNSFANSFNPYLSNIKVQLALTAIGATLATGIAIFSYQSFQRDARGRALKKEPLSNAKTRGIQDSRTSNNTADVKQFDETLIREQLARNIAFLGEEGVNKLRKSFIIIVGAGGVGSWAALMLVRSGIQHIRIIDFDQVTLSSLNRHAVATHADVGSPKVVALQKNFKEFAPWAKVEPVIELFTKSSAPHLLKGNPDFIIDAIDNIDTKIDLLKYCHDNKLPIMSSMGAGAKADPSRVQISDISQTIEDPLARVVRRRLKKLGVESGITVVYSSEKPNVKLLPLKESQLQNASDYATLPDFRSRILPVLGNNSSVFHFTSDLTNNHHINNPGTIPAIFGMSIATYIITNISGHPIEPLANKNRDALYARMHRDLLNRERRTYGLESIPFDFHEVGYIFDEIWRSKSAISGSSEKPTLIRWKHDQSLTHQNCVVMTKSEADAHEKIKDPENSYPSEVVKLVKARFQEEKMISYFR
ncbi:11962_t:CDS:2 [Acaulospora morrowiae]|uniref:11962_t:CDS:1 n=1 Tax=Acaulospora morrowiae TaxID=94023 RepID=A0A9N9B8Y0_9GLOM|nr:11962_t:CDS:2 [Acaulospora morrowiae]